MNNFSLGPPNFNSIKLQVISSCLSSINCLSSSSRGIYWYLGNGGDVAFGLSVVLFVVQFGGAALFSSLAHVATFVFI